MGRGGALGAGLDDEVLVGAGEAGEPVQHLRTHEDNAVRLLGRGVGYQGERGRARTGSLEAGDAGRKREKVMGQPREALWWRKRRLWPPNILVLLSCSSAAAGGGAAAAIARSPARCVGEEWWWVETGLGDGSVVDSRSRRDADIQTPMVTRSPLLGLICTAPAQAHVHELGRSSDCCLAS